MASDKTVLEAGPDGRSLPSAEPVRVAEGLGKRFGDLVAVDEVSFRIDAGETFGLLGPNGAGRGGDQMPPPNTSSQVANAL